MKTIRLYHSIICPRCALARRQLKKLRKEFPDIEIDAVEVLTNRDKMKDDGVKMFPALVHSDKSLSGFILTRAAIRNYLTNL
jgi:predicted DsbA family dithiol-disulfide isomerase